MGNFRILSTMVRFFFLYARASQAHIRRRRTYTFPV